MNKAFLTILILVIGTICNAQIIQTTYYKNDFLKKETTAEKAKFSKIVTENTDGTIKTETFDIEKNEIISSETYKGDEPFGTWKHRRFNMEYESLEYEFLDFSFDLIFSANPVADSIAGVKNYFENNDSINYIAPKISSGEQAISEFLAKNIRYPRMARENGIAGMVYMTFSVTKEGVIENIVVKNGANILLAKEAVRVLRKIKFSAPALLNGQPQSICPTLPMKYTLAK